MVASFRVNVLVTFGLCDLSFLCTFPTITSYWLSIEVRRGCNADTPWVFTYYARELQDIRSGYWRISYYDLSACVAGYIVFELYDKYPLWALSRDLIRDIRELYLVSVLGLKRNSDELRRLLEVFESTIFAGLNPK